MRTALGMFGKPGIRSRIGIAAPKLALVLALALVLSSYYPILAPLIDNRLIFAYGDFWGIYGEDSGEFRREDTLYAFARGSNRVETNRFYPLAGLSILSEWVSFTDSQFISALILISIILGGIGVYLLSCGLAEGWRYQSALVLALVPFYFLNLWSIERIGHLWIWVTYAIFPLFLALGLEFIRSGRVSGLAGYSLAFSFFGFPPHSLIYLLMLHGLLVVYAFAKSRNGHSHLLLAIAPLLAYALINSPPLSLGSAGGGDMVSGISSESISMLSRHGNLINLLAFSNNWWPQVGLERIYDNPGFTYSSIGLFAALFAAFAFSYEGLRREWQLLSAFALAMILALIFVSQGAANDLLAPILESVAESDFSMLLRPFREWARTSILIPVLMAVVFAASAGCKKWRLPAVVLLAVLVSANIHFSPIWEYFNNVYMPVYVGGELQAIQESLEDGSRWMWLGVYDKGIPAQALSGDPRATNTYLAYLSGFRHGYGASSVSAYEDAENLMAAPQPLLQALNIRSVFSMDVENVSALYLRMECRQAGAITVCDDRMPSQPFRVYEGAIVSGHEWAETLYHVPSENYAVTQDAGPHVGYAAPSGGMQKAANATGTVYIIDAQTGLKGPKRYFSSPFATNRSEAAFTRPQNASIDIAASGRYRVALLGNGRFFVSVNGMDIGWVNATREFGHSVPFPLERGLAGLSVESGNMAGTLDALLIYPVSSDNDYGIFSTETAPPAVIGSHLMEDPTRHLLEVNASRPFLLSFAETFDRYWVAEVFRDGSLIRRIEPIMLYGAMNGYWIEETGELEIRLRYLPQETYENAMVVSCMAIIACMALIVRPHLIGGESA